MQLFAHALGDKSTYPFIAPQDGTSHISFGCATQPGAVDVFLDFISYSGGPLPERLLEQMPPNVPVSILWGADDPWEDMKEGRRLFAHWPCVTGKFGDNLLSLQTMQAKRHYQSHEVIMT